eukprot:ANDGO_07166.mRNA.1 GTPase activating protein 1
MVGIVKVRVVAARDLPVMDRASNLTDAYVEIHFVDRPPVRTEIAYKSLSPLWNEDFRVDVSSETALHDSPLQFHVYDHDVLNDDLIGVVLVDLRPLLCGSPYGSEISGWFGIYDPLLGIRGELYVVVKLVFFGDSYTVGSVGLPIFGSVCVPDGYSLSSVCGFVEELLIDDDPEHGWMDTFRSSRASNLARMDVLYGLSGRLRRVLDRKARDIGANAIVGFRQCFDFEKKYGIVVRGYGTACVLVERSVSGGQVMPITVYGTSSAPKQLSFSPKTHRSLDSAFLPSSPQPQPLGHSPEIASGRISMTAGSVDSDSTAGRRLRKSNPAMKTVEVQDVSLLTMSAFPRLGVRRIGGVVCARSVKVLGESSGKKEAVLQQHDAWWQELRHEIRSHAKNLNCAAVVGYLEEATVCDDIIILSVSGTAAMLDPGVVPVVGFAIRDTLLADSSSTRSPRRSTPSKRRPCSVCHLPFQIEKSPFPLKKSVCGSCGSAFVHDLLLCTCEAPLEVQSAGSARLVQARVCKVRRKGDSEIGAVFVSEVLPFLEYQLYQQLVMKIRMHGLNAAFSLRMQISLSADYVAATATCSGLFVDCLPLPPPIVIRKTLSSIDPAILGVKRQIEDLCSANRHLYVSYVQQKRLKDDNRRVAEDNEDGGSEGEYSSCYSSEEDADDHDSAGSSGSGDEVEDTENDKAVKRRTSSWRNQQLLSSETEVEPLVMDVDDEIEQDMMLSLLEPPLPSGVRTCASSAGYSSLFPNDSLAHLQHVFVIRRFQWAFVDADRLNQFYSAAHHEALTSLCNSIIFFQPCRVVGFESQSSFLNERGELQIVTSATVEAESAAMDVPASRRPSSKSTDSSVGIRGHSSGLGGAYNRDSEEDLLFLMDHDSGTASLTDKPQEADSPESRTDTLAKTISAESVILSSTDSLPYATVLRNVGHISVHVVRESSDVEKTSSTLSNFTYQAMADVESLIRSHVASLGGNALLHVRIDKFMFEDNETNHEAYCFVSISGDVAFADLRNSDRERDDISCRIWLHGSRSPAFGK